MKVKNDRLEALRMIISSQELGSQDELLEALKSEGFQLTQATLSRDLKQLKVAKAATMRGNYVYVLPNDTMYKRVSTPRSIHEMMQVPGFLSIHFSGNMGVIKTRPGYASSIAYNIDNSHIIMHNMVTGKLCPQPWCRNEAALVNWNNFLSKLNITIPTKPAETQPSSQQTQAPAYIVKITAAVLNIRSGPSIVYPVVGQIKDMGKYTIVEEKSGWGKLKSGKGWISLKYTKKI